MKLTGMFLALYLTGAVIQCDRRDTPDEVYMNILRCEIAAICQGETTRYGMVGDSWTDMAGGLPVEKDLHDWLVEEYRYSITSSVIAGIQANDEALRYKNWTRVIGSSGHDLRYMLLSLGGNDLIYANSKYATNSGGSSAEMQARLDLIESSIRRIVTEGNAYKIALYGGDPLIWIIHGYDYPNPDIETESCISGAISAGMTESEAWNLSTSMVDQLNHLYGRLSSEIYQFHYIDLRGTLGGGPRSNPSFKRDCIHPNSAGFGMLASRYVPILRGIAPEGP